MLFMYEIFSITLEYTHVIVGDSQTGAYLLCMFSVYMHGT